jgi:hypothetical protein
MDKLGGISLALSLLIAATPAAAQDAAPADQSAIVVTGEKNTKQAIRDFVRALTPVGSSEQISRFELSVCPAVFGLPQAQAAAIARRMRLVAQSAGLDLGSASCTPNVLVIVTAEKKALLEQLQKIRPNYFGELSTRQIIKLENSPGPAAAWQLAGSEVNSDGVEIPSDRDSAKIDFEAPVNSTITNPSRLTVPTRPRFVAAVVVVESAALNGLTTTQLSDYATMRTLGAADPERLQKSNAPTILRILDAPMGTEVPITMTDWDFGFLRGMYTGRRDLRTAAQRSSIGDTVAKQVEHRAPK